MNEDLARRCMMVNRVKQLRATGLKSHEIAERLKLTESTVRSMIRIIDASYTKKD